jgi:hypothetical protein
MKRLRLVISLAVLVSSASGCNCAPNCGGLPLLAGLQRLVMPCLYGPYPGNGQGMVGTPGGPGCVNCGPGQTSDGAPTSTNKPDDGSEGPPPRADRSYPAYSTTRN